MANEIQKSIFGRMPDGTEIEQYTLTNANGLSCKIITYGGIITEINTPDRNGKFANIVLGYDNLEDYLKCTDYRGAIIGRVANRIAGASFDLDGKTYKLAANDGPNHLHGGVRGLDKQIWKTRAFNNNAPAVVMDYESADGEEGYPGALHVQAIYAWSDNNTLSVMLSAKSDVPTMVNLTHHPYWNLSGEKDILKHELEITAGFYTPLFADHLPRGTIASVEGTAFDFRTRTPIGSRLNQLPGEPRGYNVNYAFKHARNSQAYARLCDPKSGRYLDVVSNQPGLQLYSGTFLKEPYQGVCLEPQNYPDAIHHENFPSPLIEAGEFYSNLMFYYFRTY